MGTIKAFRNHPVVTYYALVFAISWGGILLLVGGPGGIPGSSEQVETMMPLVLVALFAGPSVAGILMTGLVSGRAGLRELLSRLLRWRVRARWYAAALLPAPLMVTTVLLALSLFSPEFIPGIVTTDNKIAVLLFGIGWGLLGGGLLEELGWTGFAVPTLRRRYDVVTTGLIVGVLWGAWHFLQGLFISGTYSGGLPLAVFVPMNFLAAVAQLTAYRVLLVWVYDRTGSLLVVTLMHASLTASTIFIFTPLATGVSFLTYVWVFAGALWVVVAALAVANRGQLSRQPLRTRVA